jgi:hypothetical protein
MIEIQKKFIIEKNKNGVFNTSDLEELSRLLSDVLKIEIVFHPVVGRKGEGLMISVNNLTDDDE